MSESVLPKEGAILKALIEIIGTIKNEENFERIEFFVKKAPTIDKKIPQWYFDFVQTLSQLYDLGYTNALKENESLK